MSIRSTHNGTEMTMASKNGHQRIIKLLKEAGEKEQSFSESSTLRIVNLRGV